ncbi:unnamed protein product [Sphagnum balticum]
MASPPSPVSQNSIVMSGVSTNSSVSCNGGSTGAAAAGVEKLVSDIESLLYRPADETFSDVIIHVDGKRVAAHRCILAVRCPYFRRLFAAAAENKNKNKNKEERREEDATKAVEVKLETLMKNNDKGEKVGYEAFMAVMGYVYGSGGLNPVVCSSSVSCLDPSCPHITCRPAIEFVLEILRASSILEISELKAAAQQHLMNMVHNAQVDDILLILAVADAHSALHLHSMCLQVIAHSELSILTLEKELSKSAMEEVVDLRRRLGVPELDMDSPQAKQCKRVYRALDLDDVELVQMLLKEERTTLNYTYGLHYAAMYCDPKIMVDLLKLEIADTNMRNERGFTVLHVAALRREPQMIGALLARGANLQDVTPDGRTALQICRRLGKKTVAQDVDDECQKDHLCIEILEQAERNTLAFSKPTADVFSVPLWQEKELQESLSYLENRVALGRLLFPQQSKILLSITHLDSTPQFTGVDNCSSVTSTRVKSGRRELKQVVDSRETPAMIQAGGPLFNSHGNEVKMTAVNEALLQRIVALRTTVEWAHRIFPNCSRVVDTYVTDEEVLDLSEKESSEEQIKKKRRFAELNLMLAEAFIKDMAEIDNQNMSRKVTRSLLSSSLTSSTINEIGCTID